MEGYVNRRFSTFREDGAPCVKVSDQGFVVRIHERGSEVYERQLDDKDVVLYWGGIILLDNNDIHDLWYDYAIAFVSLKNNSARGWGDLTPEQQEIAALWLLEADVFNGGFVQFFCNWGEEALVHAVRALQTIGAADELTYVNACFDCIRHLENDERLTELWDIPRFLTDQEEQQLDTLDQRFWNGESQIAPKAYEHYARTLKIAVP
ncbi:hypothetical protein PAECIP111890_00120 [Paenibacillus sp. JJ-223]|nr:hypothetical protein PAECIP111890_00120 [Paenibacillus sp. JJ-223]